jgi:flagellar biosynthetic protein FliP
MSTVLRRLAVALLATFVVVLLGVAPAHAQTPPSGSNNITAPTVNAPVAPAVGSPSSGGSSASINLDLGQTKDGAVPTQSLVIILLITLLSVAPALLIMMTSFTRVVVVLSLTRNALGLQSIPPNQVVVGLALFLSLFLMAPTLKNLNEDALQPFLKGTKTQAEALKAAEAPMRKFMLEQTNEGELALFVKASGAEKPAKASDVSMTALVPAYILSELKTAFIIGFIIFVPFLVIDLVVSSSLMSMGMMMLPPVLISLPFKLLLFVMVDGWALVVRALISSFN